MSPVIAVAIVMAARETIVPLARIATANAKARRAHKAAMADKGRQP